LRSCVLAIQGKAMEARGLRCRARAALVRAREGGVFVVGTVLRVL